MGSRVAPAVRASHGLAGDLLPSGCVNQETWFRTIWGEFNDTVTVFVRERHRCSEREVGSGKDTAS